MFLLLLPHTPRSTLFPYTTLFRSRLESTESGASRATITDANRAEIFNGQAPAKNHEEALDWLLSWLGQQSDRKSTRLNSSHRCISYAVFCSKKKTHTASVPR